MKQLFILFLLFVSIVGYSQEQTVQAPADSVVKTWDLEHDAWKAWNKIDSVWMDSIYWTTLKKHKIKMSCAHCERVMLSVDMRIDSSGHMAEYRVEKSYLCGSEFSNQLEKDFMLYFEALIFPQPLRNRVIRALLGTGLKC